MINLRNDIKDLLAVILLVTLILSYLLHFLGFSLGYIFGDLGDARLNNYFLEHGYQFLTGNHNSFWSPPFYFPAENVLTYSDNHIGTLPFYSVFRLLGYDVETSYQLWIILIFLLNGISAYAVMRLFKLSIIGSFTGALVFAISAPIILKTGHIQLMPRFMLPFIFYAGVKFFETLDIKYYYIFAFSFVYQFYIGIYIGFFALAGLFLLLPFILIYFNKSKLRVVFINKKYVVNIVFVSLISAALLYLLFEPYLSFKEVSGGRSWGEISAMLPRLESWIYSSGSYLDLVNKVGINLPMQHEHFMFYGFLTYLIFFYFIYFVIKNNLSASFKTNSTLIYGSILLILLTFIFTLSFHGVSLYKVTFYQFPGFDAIRAVTRIILFLALPFALLYALLFTIIEKAKINEKCKFFILFIFSLITLAEQYRFEVPVYEKAYAQNRYLNIYNKVKDYEGYDVIYLLRQKPNPGFFSDELDAMFLALALNKPTINGYSGNLPEGYHLWNSHDYISWLSRNDNQESLSVLVIGLEGGEIVQP